MSEFQKSKPIFYFAAFAVLGAFAGVGVVSVVVSDLANQLSREHGEAFTAGSIPKLIIGAVLGFGLGLAFALFLFKTRPEDAQKAVEKKYGLGQIFSGVPVFLMVIFTALIFPWWDRLERRFGIAAVPCILCGMCAVILLLSLLVRPRIPHRLIVPFGLLGWILTLIIGCWVGWVLDHKP